MSPEMHWSGAHLTHIRAHVSAKLHGNYHLFCNLVQRNLLPDAISPGLRETLGPGHTIRRPERRATESSSKGPRGWPFTQPGLFGPGIETLKNLPEA